MLVQGQPKHKNRILIKIASTWEGIRAAEILENEGIHCNLTLLFGLHQAIACADAGVTLISPFVGRILDWYKKETGLEYAPSADPGVLSVTQIYNYYKKFGYETEVMGASFRNIGEIIELAGCDLLTISPNLLAQLQETTGELSRKLDPAIAATMDIKKLAIDQTMFDQMHSTDRMAAQKLDEGIKGFSKALETLEGLLAGRLVKLEITMAKSPPKKWDQDWEQFYKWQPNKIQIVQQHSWRIPKAVTLLTGEKEYRPQIGKNCHLRLYPTEISISIELNSILVKNNTNASILKRGSSRIKVEA